MNAACNGRAACFELFGFDVLLDKALKPWLIEVNVACSLASSSPLDKWIKNMLMTDLFHLIGLVPFHKKAAPLSLMLRQVNPFPHRPGFVLGAR
jgi:hypothetical protein